MPTPAKPAVTAKAARPEQSSVAHLLTRIIVLIDQIITVMDDEIILVEQRKRVEHAELLKVKQRLTLDYRSSLKSIVLDPNCLREVPEELRAKARAAAERLADASGRNARALRAIMTASQRLVQSIVAIVKSEVLPQGGYKKVQSAAYSPTCKPVTVYQSV